MHAVFFGIKRAHLGVVHGLARRLLRGSGLTAARFDLMRAVYTHPDILQSTLRWLLGVSAPTVSRMVKALEGLGLVARAKDRRDGRCRRIRVTADGEAAVERALSATVGNREVERAVARCAIGDTQSAEASGGAEETNAAIEEAAEETLILRRAVFRTRKALFDSAPYAEPWPIHRPFGPVASARFRAPDYTDEMILSADWLTEEEWLAC